MTSRGPSEPRHYCTTDVACNDKTHIVTTSIEGFVVLQPLNLVVGLAIRSRSRCTRFTICVVCVLPGAVLCRSHNCGDGQQQNSDLRGGAASCDAFAHH